MRFADFSKYDKEIKKNTFIKTHFCQPFVTSVKFFVFEYGVIMKRFLICLGLLAAVVAACVFFAGRQESAEIHKNLIRIHIRANSDDAEDQRVKFQVKDCLTDYLTSKMEGIRDVADARALIENEKSQLKSLSDKVLLSLGKDYVSAVELKTEYFPTRVYDGVTLEAGNYTALIVELGSGTGANWWCIMYPPLCFINTDGGTGDFEYRSWIQEMLNGMK